MAKQEKDIQVFVPIEGMDSDTAENQLLPYKTRRQVNCRGYTFGKKGVVTNLLGNTQIPYDLPGGTNITLGAEADEDLNRIYFVNYNSNGYHTWYILDTIANNISILFQSITMSGGIDVMRLNPNNLILDIHIEAHDLIYYVDQGNEKARKWSISKMLDKSQSGYGTVVLEEYMTAQKKAPVYAPQAVYFTDITRPSNNLFNLQFKFLYRWIYDNFEQSNYSDFTPVPKPINQPYYGISAIDTDNNGINVTINTGSKLVIKAEIAVQIGSSAPVTCAVIHKDELGLADNTTYTFPFYNDGAYVATDPSKIYRLFSALPRNPFAQAKASNTMTYTNFVEGWPVVAVKAAVALSFQNLFLPDSTVDQFNNPSIAISLFSNTILSAGFFSGGWIITDTHFVIGADVKAGNIFTVIGNNGASDYYFFQVKASLSDNAITIANAIKTFLRSIGRGYPGSTNGITGEGTDISGSVHFDFTYRGKYNENATTWTGSVTKILYSTLKDTGQTVQTMKRGSTRSYGIMYSSEDTDCSLAYTSDDLTTKIPFVTEPGQQPLQLPVHTISIFHQPPVRARYWQLVRTSDITDFIQILIQQVIDVDITMTDQGAYLDLVIGSLFTYQKAHPNTIIAYTPQKGDRIRLIKDEVANTLYPYYETEVLYYSSSKTEIVNAQIKVYGTDHVTPSNGVNASYVGKDIIIEGFRRTITGISGSDYTLDQIIDIGNVTAPTTVIANGYTFIDDRGTIRISRPSNITVENFSLVEIYAPQKNSADAQEKIFQLCGLKFEVSNAGTDQRAHRGNLQDQDGTSPSTLVSTPAIVQYSGGDVYVRYRELPTNNQVPDTEVIIDHIEDPNASDWYESNLTDLGLPIPQDTGAGEVLFSARTRFSNNYIQNTQINGLNDFDPLDYVDYNDSYGATQRTIVLEDRFYMFKELRTAWTFLNKSIIVDNTGAQVIATSSKLLNQIDYFKLQGGVGQNPESVITDGSYIYFASVNYGAFIRIADNGCEPISKVFDYDVDSKKLLNIAGKYNLKLIPCIDRSTNEVYWTLPAYIPYLFNKAFLPNEWNTSNPAVPSGTTYVITTAPVNSSVSIVGGLFVITDGGVLGDDFFLYQAHYPGGSTGPIMKFCFTVVNPPPSPGEWRVRTSTVACEETSGGANTGNQYWSTLEGYNVSDGSLNGLIMPNVAKIDPLAIVPDGTTITYNQNSNVTPTGGADGDIWYNEPADNLYKRISGTWTLLTSRVTNAYYIIPVINTGSCPLPADNNLTLHANNYGMTITGVNNGTTTGIPPAVNSVSIGPGTSQSYNYSSIGGPGTIRVSLTGIPVSGAVHLHLVVNGTLVDNQPITGSGDVFLTLAASTVNDPVPILIEVDLG